MSRPLDADRLAVLESVAESAATSGVFVHLVAPETPDAPPMTVRQRRALMALIAADELGMSLIDALNRVRFTEQGLTFAPAVDTTFEEVLRAEVASAQKEAKKEAQKEAQKEAHDAPAALGLSTGEAAARIPADYTPSGKLLVECSVGELGYFVEESMKKGAVSGIRAVAWKVLSARIPSASALDLGKLTRWILNPKTPDRRVNFKDVLVAAEARLEELGETAVRP